MSERDENNVDVQTERSIMAEIFGEDAIYVYGDNEAVEDGMLIDTTLVQTRYHGKIINRVTASAMQFIMTTIRDIKLDRTEELLPASTQELSLVFGCLLRFARQPTAPNSIHLLGVGAGSSRHILWLVENEVSGYTLMFPEDY